MCIHLSICVIQIHLSGNDATLVDFDLLKNQYTIWMRYLKSSGIMFFFRIWDAAKDPENVDRSWHRVAQNTHIFWSQRVFLSAKDSYLIASAAVVYPLVNIQKTMENHHF